MKTLTLATLAGLLATPCLSGAELARLTAADAGANDQFGIALAQDADFLAVGAWRDDNVVLAAGAAYLFQQGPAGPHSWLQRKKLIADDAAASDNFGNALALRADTLAVAAVGDDDAASDAGAVYLFQRNLGGQDNWGQVKKIIPDDATPSDQFATAVALSDDWLVVGAPNHDGTGPDSGTVYLYQRHAGGADNWGFVKQLLPSPGANLSQFGQAVAIDQDTILVGAWRDGDQATNAGAAYVFERNLGGPDNWGLSARLVPGTSAAGDNFGAAVALEGDIIAVGASQADNPNGPGAVYLFARQPGSPAQFTELQKLLASQGSDGARFGHSLALSQSWLLVGAPQESRHGHNAGTAYVYEWNLGSSLWAQLQELNGSLNSADYRFGNAVAIQGNLVSVGAPQDARTAVDSGAAYIFYSLAPRPALEISRQEDLVVVAWSPDTPGYTLEETPSLSLASWKDSPLSNSPVASRFFRLRGSPPVSVDFVPVGDPANPNDANGLGQVTASFQIGAFEVTNDQYARFLNAVAASDPSQLYNTAMADDPRAGILRSGTPGAYRYSVKLYMGNKPVNYVSFFDALRFANWLHNGQPAGAQDASTTEDGSYTFSGPITVGARNAGAKVWLPDENEWYKAAYYDPTKTETGGYWLNPTRSDTSPTPALADGTGNITNSAPQLANYNLGATWNGQEGNVTTVGSGGLHSQSFYGAADLAGNVWEWTEAVQNTRRGLRGGSWLDFEGSLESSDRSFDLPTREDNLVGFRVARP